MNKLSTFLLIAGGAWLAFILSVPIIVPQGIEIDYTMLGAYTIPGIVVLFFGVRSRNKVKTQLAN